MAVVSSLRSFDREQQKEYLVPIVIKDSGNPSMTGTSTLTVIIGDSNDNKMQPGSKDILVYNYMVSNDNNDIEFKHNMYKSLPILHTGPVPEYRDRPRVRV